MNFISIKAPAAGAALTGKAIELFNAVLCIAAASQTLQVVPDQLIEALSKGLPLFSGALNKLSVDR